jgi:hypothetical protein
VNAVNAKNAEHAQNAQEAKIAQAGAWYRDRYFYLSFGICLLLAFCSFIYFIVRGNGFFSIRSDFNTQQMPFTIGAIREIRENGFGWIYSADLGTNTIAAYSFSQLGSPFFWILFLLPTSKVPYAVGWIYMLKYGLAGGTSYLYLRRYVKKETSAVFGALLYAFSGFQTVNLMFYCFHDAVALFPLMLIGLDDLAENGKKGLFALSVAINCFLNYFLFVGEIIFLAIYYFCRFGTLHPEKKDAVKFLRVLGEGVLGVGMAFILFWPSVCYIVTLPRAGAKIYGDSGLVYNSRTCLQLIKAFLLPGDNMRLQSCIQGRDYSSKGAYLPGVGLSLVLAYCRKRRGWLRRLLLILLVISFIPLFNSSFYMFSQSYWRWWYMFILIMALASAVVFENMTEYPVAGSAKAVLVSLMLFTAYLTLLPWSERTDIRAIRRPLVFAGFVILSAAGLIMLLVFSKRKNARKLTFIMTAAVAVCSTTWAIHSLRDNHGGDPSQLLVKYSLAAQAENYDINYRYATSGNLYEYIGGISTVAAGPASFSSTVSASIFELNEAFGYTRTVNSLNYGKIPGMSEWLAGKYVIADQSHVTERECCPISYAYRYYLPRSVFDTLDNTRKAIASIHAMVVPDDRVQEYSGVLESFDLSKLPPDGEKNLSVYIKKAVRESLRNKLQIVKMDKNGFEITGNAEQACYAFASIPYDQGWTAYVNGTETEITDVSGLMAVPIGKGANDIVFSYRIPGLRTGAAVSLDAWILFAALLALRGTAIHWRRPKISKQFISAVCFAIPVLCLFTAFQYFRYYLSNRIDTDQSSELVLSKLISEEHTIVSGNWYYFTELRVLNTQLVFAPLFYVFSSWRKVRIVGETILVALLGFSAYFLGRRMKISRNRSLLLSALLMVPFSEEYFWFIIKGSYYVPHVFISFITMGLLYLYLDSQNKRRKILSLVLTAALSLGAGLGGPRQPMVLYIPLEISALFLWLNGRKREDRSAEGEGDASVRSRYLLISTCSFICGMAGYLINRFYLTTVFSFRDYSGLTFRKPDLKKIMQVATGLPVTLGFGFDKANLPLSLAGDLFGTFLILVFVLAVKDAVRKKESTFAEKSLMSLFFAGTICMMLLYSFTNMPYHHRYWLPLIVFVIVEDTAYIARKKVRNSRIMPILIAFGVLTAVVGGLRYGAQREDSNIEYRAIVSAAERNGIYASFSSYWNGNILTELSDGRIEAYNWPEFIDKQKDIMQMCVHLQVKAHATEKPPGKVMCVFTREQIRNSPMAGLFSGSEVLYESGNFVVYRFDSYADMVRQAGE